MAKRPMCLLCFLMVLSLGALELMGIPLIRGNPLPLNVQEQIESLLPQQEQEQHLTMGQTM